MGEDIRAQPAGTMKGSQSDDRIDQRNDSYMREHQRDEKRTQREKQNESMKQEIIEEPNTSNSKDPKIILFPHDTIRNFQDDMLFSALEAIKNNKHMIIHAPTGIGKTAIIGPALAFALENKKRVFFLTSRHTQHIIAINTLTAIKEKYNLNFKVADIIGKKWMCSQSGTINMGTLEFTEYCRDLRNNYSCEFYVNTREKSGKPKSEALVLLEDIKSHPSHSELVKNMCEEKKLCPYEVASLIASEAEVIVADYYYMFHPKIRESFLQKHGINLSDSIIIVDEAHNLPERIINLMSSKISSLSVNRAIREAEKFDYKELIKILSAVEKIIMDLSKNLNFGEEKLLSKNDVIKALEEEMDIHESIASLQFAGEEIRELQKFSSVGSVGIFLETWNGPDEGFARIISKPKGDIINITYKCLDPSQISSEVINKSHSTIIMSATLNPEDMYSDILGFPKHRVIMKSYKSPFPKDNKLNLILPLATTKFSERTELQYKNIANICQDIVNKTPGNSLIIFPSYKLLDDVNKYFQTLSKYTVFKEVSNMTKEEKKEFLEKFESYSKSKRFAVMLAVSSGSFNEGIDMPGVLKCVIIAGLPLQTPDLETKELIKHYDKKFSKGMDYGYIFPAMYKVIQGAGRCIRSEKDSGILVFLDSRYLWHNYYRCFPPDWDMIAAKTYQHHIEEFFKRDQENGLND